MANEKPSAEGAPEPTSPFYPAHGLHESITLYEGNLAVIDQGREFPYPSLVRLDWLPSPYVRFKFTRPGIIPLKLACGELDESAIKLPSMKHVPNPPSDGNSSPQVAETGFDGNLQGVEIGGSVPLSNVTFYVANFPRFLGEFLHFGKSKWRGRLNLVADPWQITLDARQDYTEIQREVRKVGGYAQTHTGDIRRRDQRTFSAKDVSGALEMLRMLLSFATGRWVSTVLPVGFDKVQKPVWSDWRMYRLTRWTGSFMAVDMGHPDHLIEFVRLAASAWSDGFRRRVLRSAIDYFVDGNRPDPLELAVSTTQAGLELLTWTYLVEDSKQLNPNEYKKKPAGEKIDTFLRDKKIDTRVPNKLTNLVTYTKNGTLSGPAIIAEMRNTIIHPKRQSRTFDLDTWAEAWMLAQRFLLLGILSYVGYSKGYRDPVNENKHIGAVDTVPWKT